MAWLKQLKKLGRRLIKWFFRISLWINASSFFSKKIRDWDCFASLMIPLFAKNSRLGYFFNANNPHRQQVGSATLPQGESDKTESVKNITKKFYGV